MFLVIIGLGILILLWGRWTKLTFMQKLACKIVGVYLAAGVLFFAGIYFIYGMIETYDAAKDNNINQRLQETEYYLNNGHYNVARTYLSNNYCYEEEFEYAWERVLIYDAYNRYAIRMNAIEAVLETEGESEYVLALREQAQEYKQELLELCEKSTEPKNKIYVDYYRNLLYNQ